MASTEQNNPGAPVQPGAPQKASDTPVSNGSKIRLAREIKPNQIGIRTWFEPEKTDSIEVDIVAVHGIGADPDETWVHREKKMNWLKNEQMLPKALENKARILRFGYNSVWYGKKATRLSLSGIAVKLLSALLDEREDCPDRPIVFIGHCFGGTVIQGAYVESKKDLAAYPGIYDSITGIVFLGTPHQGNSSTQTQDKIFAAIVEAGMHMQNNILSTVAQDNDVLVQVVHDFTRDVLSAENAPKLYCFFEEVQVNYGKLAGVDDTPMEFVVNRVSGTLNGHLSEGLALDHFEMNGFEDHEDGNYNSVKRQIKKMVQGSKAIMNAREKTRAPQPQALQRQYLSSSKLPFPSEPNFAARGGILKKIEEKFGKTVKVALCGGAGSGKTQLALEYSYKFSEDYPGSRIFWVNCSSTEQTQRSYKLISASLQLGTVGADVSKAVHHQLKQDANGYWLLILDGAEDRDAGNAENSNEGDRNPRLEDIPVGLSGRVLITTRSMALASRVVNQKAEYIVEMPTLSDDDAVQLLLGTPTTDRSRKKSALSVAQALACSPVALDLASAYRAAAGRDFTLSTYLEKLQSQDLKLECKGGAESGVARAWQLMYEFLNEKHPEAARLMLLVGILDLQSIGTFFLAKTAETRAQFDQQVSVLVAHRMIKLSVNRNDVTATRMVQLCVQAWLAKTEKKTWAEEWATGLLNDMYPAPESQEHATCDILHPCAAVMLKFQPTSAHGKQIRAGLLFKMAGYLRHLGQYPVALQHLEECLALQEKDPDKTGNLINQTKRAIEELQAEQHRSETAPELTISTSPVGQQSQQLTLTKLKSDIAEMEKKMGKNHYDTIRNVADRAAILHRQDPSAEGPALRQRTVKYCDEKLGPDHMTTVRARYNLGLAHDGLGQYEEAAAMYLSAFESAERQLGPGNPELLLILSSLARVYCTQGKLSEAQKTMQVVLAGQQDKLGPDHPETLVTRQNAALIAQDMGHLDEADIELRAVLTTQTNVLGQEHEATLRTAATLGRNYRLRAKFQEAEHLFRATLESQERTLVDSHPDTVTTRLMLAETLRDVGKTSDARSLYKTVEGDVTKIWGETHPDTVHVKQSIQALA